MRKFQIANGVIRNFQFVLVTILFFSSCWHEQWEDRLASGDTGTVTHGPKSAGPDTTTRKGDYYSGCVPSSSYHYSGSGPNGRDLFRKKCASCHNASDKRSTGPGLRDVMSRVPSKKWLYAFIRNSDSVIKSGDAYANKLYQENGKANQTQFPDLTNEEIDAILDYCDAGSSNVPIY